MALIGEEAVARLKLDTTEYARGLDRATQQTRQFAGQAGASLANLSLQQQQRIQSLGQGAVSLGMAAETASHGGTNAALAFAALASQASGMAVKTGAASGALAGIGAAAIGLLGPLAAVIAIVTVAYKIVDKLMVAAAREDLAKLRKEVNQWMAETPKAIWRQALVDWEAELEAMQPPAWLTRPGATGAAGARAGRGRGGGAGPAGPGPVSVDIADVLARGAAGGVEAGAQEGVIARLQTEIAEGLTAFDEFAEKRRETFGAMRLEILEELATLGIDPEEARGLASTLLPEEDTEAALERMDLVTAKITGDLRAIGNMAKSSAAAGFEAFYHSIFAGQGAGAAFRALTKTILDALANQALAKAAFQTAEGLAALAWGNFAAAGLHFKSAGVYLAIGGLAKGLGAAAGGGGGGGGGGGFAGATGEGAGGGFRPRGGEGFAPSPLDREPRQTTVILQVEGARLGHAVIGAIEASERESGRRRLR